MASSSAPITPVKIPRRVRTVVVLGGMFDPPHFYHTIGPLSVVNRLFGKAGWLLYIPAARSPLKPAGPVAGDEHRLAMLKLALDTPGPRSIWTDEIDRARWRRDHGPERGPDRSGVPSYTIDTLRRLRRVLPAGVTLRLLIGADQAADFHKWKNFRAIIRLAEPLVMARGPIEKATSLYSSLDPKVWTKAERAAWCTRMAPNFPLPAASTQIRAAIPKAPNDPDKWNARPPLNEVTTRVAAYIIAHDLYGFRGRTPRPADPNVRAVPILGDTPAGRAAFNRSMQRGVLTIAKEVGRLRRSKKRTGPTRRKPPGTRATTRRGTAKTSKRSR